VGEEGGGAIWNQGTLTATNVIFEYNWATGSGGAIYNTVEMALSNTVFRYNISLTQGGAIYNAGTTASLTDSCIFNNAAPEAAGLFSAVTLNVSNIWWGGLKGGEFPNKNIVTIAGVEGENGNLTNALASSEGPCKPNAPYTISSKNEAGTTVTDYCLVRPLRQSFYDDLTTAGTVAWRTQEVLDMKSVVLGADVTLTGLLSHYGPTINSPLNREGVVAKVEQFPWDTRHLVVTKRVQFPADSEDPQQVWYYVEFDTATHTAPNGDTVNGAWIAARYGDFFYVEGVGVSSRAYPYDATLGNMPNTDHCNGYVPTINDSAEYEEGGQCVTNPSLCQVTFYYDRETVAEFGIAQATANGDGSSVGEQSVTASLPDFPITAFTYSQLTGQVGGTGSSVFISELLWVGAFPATQSFIDSAWTPVQKCYDRAPEGSNYKGWRYCHGNITGIDVWTQHEEIVGYYVEGGFSLPQDVDQIELAITRDSYVPLVEISPGSFDPLINQGKFSVEINPEDIFTYFSALDVLDSTVIQGFYESLVAANLSDVGFGDYIFINSRYRLENVVDCNNTQPGTENPLCGDTHGFLVIGWGPLVGCSTTITTDFTFSQVNNLDTPFQTSIFPDIDTAYKDVDLTQFSVPYVVDFSGATVAGRIQTPKPRPFYCSAYDDNPSIPTQGLFYTNHDWFFFTMPDSITIPAQRVYSSVRWLRE
jgi:predicted outer membrane repeat protein